MLGEEGPCGGLGRARPTIFERAGSAACPVGGPQRLLETAGHQGDAGWPEALREGLTASGPQGLLLASSAGTGGSEARQPQPATFPRADSGAFREAVPDSLRRETATHPGRIRHGPAVTAAARFRRWLSPDRMRTGPVRTHDALRGPCARPLPPSSVEEVQGRGLASGTSDPFSSVPQAAAGRRSSRQQISPRRNGGRPPEGVENVFNARRNAFRTLNPASAPPWSAWKALPQPIRRTGHRLRSTVGAERPGQGSTPAARPFTASIHSSCHGSRWGATAFFRGAGKRNVRTSFSRTSSAAGKGLFAVCSDCLDDPDAGGTGSSLRAAGISGGKRGKGGRQLAGQEPEEVVPVVGALRAQSAQVGVLAMEGGEGPPDRRRGRRRSRTAEGRKLLQSPPYTGFLTLPGRDRRRVVAAQQRKGSSCRVPHPRIF